ncbi:heme-binding protein [Comamonas sp.]|uniref:GlcG/HbpS family heme-binding protein n=1 Tax=Comamonas sp. TaxID=34028 RepID=UPI0012D1CC87|nr:heme-binding protein [Comamonas sp.]MPT10252.1 heme-binding protein [Comamonas sp.]
MILPSIKSFSAFIFMASVHAFAAQPAPLHQSNMSLNLANALVDATMSACHSQGRSAVAAVIDRGGHLLSLQRDDSVGPHNTDAAVKKAFTALSTKTQSRIFAENARKNPESSNLNTIDSLLLIGGGVPVKVGDEVIGAIGVGGAGGSVIDEGCALEAIDKVLGTSR